MRSKSGAMDVKCCLPPNQRWKMTLVSATEVIDDVSSATEQISSIGILLISNMERTALFEAIATSGTIRRSGMLVYAAAGMMPMSADPSARARAQSEGMV